MRPFAFLACLGSLTLATPVDEGPAHIRVSNLVHALQKRYDAAAAKYGAEPALYDCASFPFVRELVWPSLPSLVDEAQKVVDLWDRLPTLPDAIPGMNLTDDVHPTQKTFRSVPLLFYGREVPWVKDEFPRLVELVSKIADQATIHAAWISALSPNEKLEPHHGPLPTMTRLHVPILLPPEVGEKESTVDEHGVPYIGLKAGDAPVVDLAAKRCVAFDDGSIHYSWNRASTARVNIFVDIQREFPAKWNLGPVQSLLDREHHYTEVVFERMAHFAAKHQLGQPSSRTYIRQAPSWSALEGSMVYLDAYLKLIGYEAKDLLECEEFPWYASYTEAITPLRPDLATDAKRAIRLFDSLPTLEDLQDFDNYAQNARTEWKAVPITFFGYWSEWAARLFPSVTKLVKTLEASMPIHTAFISVFSPNVTNNMHRGFTSAIHRIQMPLLRPESARSFEEECSPYGAMLNGGNYGDLDCWPTLGFEVNGEVLDWTTESCTVFVDTAPHRAWNHAPEYRVNLWIDIRRDFGDELGTRDLQDMIAEYFPKLNEVPARADQWAREHQLYDARVEL